MLRLHPGPIDYVILALYFAVVLGIGLIARLQIKTDLDFFLSGRSLPAWITGLAFMAANLGALEILGQAANGRTALGRGGVASLAQLRGRGFDDALWLKQVDALSQLRADYRAYADDGDDTALSKLAERELPRVEARLAALSKM